MFRKKKAYVTRVEKGHSHAILKNYMVNKLAVVAGSGADPDYPRFPAVRCVLRL